MIYYLYNPSTDTDKAVPDIGLVVVAGSTWTIDSNNISGLMLNSGNLYSELVDWPGVGTGDRGLTLHSATPPDNTNDYSQAEARERLSLAKDAINVLFDNTVASLPGSPTTVQAAVEALDERVDQLEGINWKQSVKYRVLEITAIPPSGTEGDFYVDTTNNPDQYYKYVSGSWVLVGNVLDGDRVIKLDDTGGTYNERIFVYDATGDSWSAVGENANNDSVIIGDDGDSKPAMYVFSTTSDAWIKIADVDWGSPTLQTVYDAGDNTVTMSAGGGNVDWDLHDSGSWEVSTGSLYFRASRSGAALNLTASVSSIDWDAAGAISISATGSNLTLETLTSGNVVIASAAAASVTASGDDLTLTTVTSGDINITSAAAVSIKSTSDDLTLETDTAGDIIVTSAGSIEFNITSNVTWSDGTNEWTPEQAGLRLANYTTAGLPAIPGVTTNYGAIAFDTTLDRPVVWVDDSDGSGTDGWLAILMSGDAAGGTLDDAYNEFGANPALVTIDAAEGQTTGLEWAVGTTNGTSMFVSDGTDLIVRFIADNTAGAADRVNIGDTAILKLASKASAPTANQAAGDIFYHSTSGLIYQYDGSRSKWLSSFKQALQFGASKAGGEYLTINGAQAAQTGFLMPRDGTITAVTVRSSGGLATMPFQVRRNNDSVAPLLSFSLTAGQYSNNAANVDFSAGDYIQVFAVTNAPKVDNPVVIVEIAYRV